MGGCLYRKGCRYLRGAGTDAHTRMCPCSPLLGRRRREAAEEEVEETPQEKKLRLAKQYLEELRQLGESRPAPVSRGAAPGAEPGPHALSRRRGGAGGGGGGTRAGGPHRRPAEGGRGERGRGRGRSVPLTAAGSVPFPRDRDWGHLC